VLRGGETPSPPASSQDLLCSASAYAYRFAWDSKSNGQLKVLLFFCFFFLPVVFVVTLLTNFESLVLEKSCRTGLLFQRLGVCSVQCLAVFQMAACFLPVRKATDRRTAQGRMWRVCSKDVEMSHFNQLTFQPGNQTCL